MMIDDRDAVQARRANTADAAGVLAPNASAADARGWGDVGCSPHPHAVFSDCHAAAEAERKALVPQPMPAEDVMGEELTAALARAVQDAALQAAGAAGPSLLASTTGTDELPWGFDDPESALAGVAAFDAEMEGFMQARARAAQATEQDSGGHRWRTLTRSLRLRVADSSDVLALLRGPRRVH